MYNTIATSFADPKDLLRYQEAKSEGKTEQQALAVGDNGIGFWGDNTKQGSGARSSLPESDIVKRWGTMSAGRGRLIRVWLGNKWQDTILSDLGPGKKEVEEGHGLDLNYDAWAYFGIRVPAEEKVEWDWTVDYLAILQKTV